MKLRIITCKCGHKTKVPGVRDRRSVMCEKCGSALLIPEGEAGRVMDGPQGPAASRGGYIGNGKGRPPTRKLIGELLIEAGLVTEAQLHEGLDVQAKKGGKIVEALISLGHITPASFTQFLARQPGVASIELANYEVSPELLSLVPQEFALKHEVFPIDKLSQLLTVGMACPLDSATIRELEAATGLKVKALLCAPTDIRGAINRYYSSEVGSADTVVPGQPQPVEELQAPLKLTNVARLLREIDSLPALPDTVRHVREAMSDPRRSVDDVSGIIARDPAVAAKVLSVVNSAAYGFAHRVDSLTLAVSLLGLHETYSVVLSAAAVKVFDKSRRFDYTAFWEGSMCCAAAATLIAEASGQKHVSGVLAAGLLHDIGRLALCEIAGPTYAQLQPGLNGAELLTAEESLIGLTHAEAGFELATHWNLPDAIADAIRLHHHPQRAISSKQIVAIIVALADLLADAGSDLERGERFLEGSADLFKALKLDTAMAPVLISLFCDRQAEALGKPIL